MTAGSYTAKHRHRVYLLSWHQKSLAVIRLARCWLRVSWRAALRIRRLTAILLGDKRA